MKNAKKRACKPPVGCIFRPACYNGSEVITLDKQTFGTFVAEQRKRQGLTQQQLAQLLHVTDKAVSKWERGLSYPDVTLLQPLAAALCLDTDRLLTCRREESEEHMTQITPPLPRAEASPAVQAVLDISDANSRQRRKRQRLMAAAALAIAVIAVLAVMQYNGALFISRRTVTPEGITLSFYRDSLIGGRLRMAADAPLSMADIPCIFCGKSETHDVTRLALGEELAALDALQWSADGRYLLLSGKTRGIPAYLELWDFAPDGADAGITRRNAASSILLQLSGRRDENTLAAPLLPALPGVSAHSYLPRVALSDPHWLTGSQLELSYAYDGTDGVRRSGTLVYDAARDIVRSVSGSI